MGNECCVKRTSAKLVMVGTDCSGKTTILNKLVHQDATAEPVDDHKPTLGLFDQHTLRNQILI